jgi:large subunit ribosomal protein L1
MTVDKKTLLEAVRKAKEASGERRLKQSFEISIAVEGLNPKKPESRVTVEVTLPHVPGRPQRILFFADGELAKRARDGGADIVIGREEIQRLEGNKKEIKKLVEKCDLTVAQAELMVLVGKIFGPVLGPRGKMPRPVPSTADPVPLIEKLRRTVRIMNRGQLCFQTRIGDETMKDEELVENAATVVEEIERKMTEIGGKIKAVYLKTTMGKPAKVVVK